MSREKEQKKRTVEELYSVTKEILVVGYESSHQPLRKFNRHSASGSVSMRRDSEMNNVCSAPCLSPGHCNEVVPLMEVKTESEFSDKASRVNTAMTGPFNNENGTPSFKNRAFMDPKPTARETRIVLSTNSSHESIIANAESKEALRKTKEDIEMLPTASKDHLKNASNECIESSVCPGSAGNTEEPASHCNDHLEVNEQNDKASVSILNNQDPQLTLQSDDGSNGSDMLEDEVKICDICGDVGREYLLAICSRCSDGAEHIYCMRKIRNKVPECDWLCEVCQMKDDAANQNKDECENVSGILNVSCRSEKNKISVSDSVIPFKPAASNPRVLSKRHAGNLEIPLDAKCLALESRAGPQKLLSSNKLSTLSREGSFKNMDMGKEKPIHHIASLGGESSQGTTHSPPVAVQKSSKIQPLHQPARGSLFKSSSFNPSDLKPKSEIVQEPQNKKLHKPPSVSGTRKEEPVSSFKIGSSRVTSTEGRDKLVSHNIVQAEDSRGTRLGKEKKIIEKKDSFKSDRMVSPRAGLTLSSQKDGQKVSSHAQLPSVTTGLHDMKVFQADKSSGSFKSDRMVSPRAGLSLSSQKDGQKVSSHAQLPSATTGLHDMKVFQADKSSSAPSKFISPLPHRRSQTPNVLAEHGNFKRPSSLASDSDAYPILKANSTQQKPSSDKIIEETSCSQSRGSISVADKSIQSSSLTNQDSSVSMCSDFLSIPAPDYIWQGGFEVQSSNGSHLESFDGIQAHLSITASPKVNEAVNKFSGTVQLEEVSRTSTWPDHFQNGVTEDNIALYFFPKNVERDYNRLVKNMMNYDLALKAHVDGAELLIFPSNQLCGESKRWNMFYFLWGVFRAKRGNTLERIDMTSMVVQGRTTEVFPDGSSSGHDSMSVKCPSQTANMGSSIPIKEQRLEGTFDSKDVPGDVVERYFFPVEAGTIKDLGAQGNSISVQVIPSKDEDQLSFGSLDLDLALGCEKKSPKQRIETLSEKLATKNNDHGKRPENMENDSLGSLSLSLAFPSSNEVVHRMKPVANSVPERSPLDTSLSLFGGFPNT